MKSQSQKMYESTESVFECKICKKEYVYVIIDLCYNSQKQSKCFDCNRCDDKYSDVDICKSCFDELEICLCNDCKLSDESYYDVICVCDYCEEFLGISISIDDVDTSPCKTCELDYDKNCKVRYVCSICRNQIN